MVGVSDRPTRFAFVLVPRFSMLALASAVDGLRAANIVLGRTAYDWRTAAAAPGPVRASCDLPLAAAPLAAIADADIIAVCGGDSSDKFAAPVLTDTLRQHAARGKRVGALSDGSYVLAAAGLYQGYRSTIHWKCQHAYREKYPHLDIRASLLEIDRNRFSCAGGTSALDLVLAMIMRTHGADVAGAIAENYMHDAIRIDMDQRRLSPAIRVARRSPVLARALMLMDENLEQPLRLTSIAARVGVAHRQLDRLFRAHLGRSPGAYYRDARMDRAGQLLWQTGMSVADVANACGFHSASHLARFFLRRFGMSPKAYRMADLPRAVPG